MTTLATPMSPRLFHRSERISVWFWAPYWKLMRGEVPTV